MTAAQQARAEQRVEAGRRRVEVLRRLRWSREGGRTQEQVDQSLGWPRGASGSVLRELQRLGLADVVDGVWYAQEGSVLDLEGRAYQGEAGAPVRRMDESPAARREPEPSCEPAARPQSLLDEMVRQVASIVQAHPSGIPTARVRRRMVLAHGHADDWRLGHAMREAQRLRLVRAEGRTSARTMYPVLHQRAFGPADTRPLPESISAFLAGAAPYEAPPPPTQDPPAPVEAEPAAHSPAASAPSTEGGPGLHARVSEWLDGLRPEARQQLSHHDVAALLGLLEEP